MLDIEAISSFIQESCEGRTDYPLVIDLDKEMFLSMAEFFYLRQSLRKKELVLTTSIDSWTVKTLQVNK